MHDLFINFFNFSDVWIFVIRNWIRCKGLWQWKHCIHTQGTAAFPYFIIKLMMLTFSSMMGELISYLLLLDICFLFFNWGNTIGIASSLFRVQASHVSIVFQCMQYTTECFSSLKGFKHFFHVSGAWQSSSFYIMSFSRWSWKTNICWHIWKMVESISNPS